MPRAIPTAEWPGHLWSKVQINGPDECWPWLGAKDRQGYGILAPPRAIRRIYPTHRVARLICLLDGQTIAKGMVVRHSCDNPPCCNPVHLEVGTPQQNTQDAIERGHLVNPPTAMGEANGGGGKLNAIQVREIRLKYVPRRYGLERLAAEYGVTFGMIGHIIRRRAWRHIQ